MVHSENTVLTILRVWMKFSSPAIAWRQKMARVIVCVCPLGGMALTQYAADSRLDTFVGGCPDTGGALPNFIQEFKQTSIIAPDIYKHVSVLFPQKRYQWDPTDSSITG